MLKRDNKKTVLPGRNLIILVASIFIIELFIMFVIHMSNFSLIVEDLLDSVMLIVFSSPLLYFFLYRPLVITIKEAERDKEEIRRYAHIVSVANEHMSFLDRDYIYRAVNDAYLRAHKKKREDIVNHSVAQILGQNVFDSLIKEKLDRVFAGETINYESWFDFAGAGMRYMEVTYHPYYEDDNTISGVVVDSHDITERKVAEDKLMASERKYSTLVSNIPGAVYRCDEDRNVRFISDEIEKITGYPASDFVGNKVRTFQSIIHPDDVDRIRKLAEGSIAKKVPLFVEYRIMCAEGCVCWIADMARGVFDDKGKLLSWDGLIFDIRDRKKAEAELQEAKRKAEEASEMKSNFLATMSHEIRTPMNVIIGLADVLRDADLPVEQERSLQIMSNAGNTLITLIDDILDLSRIEAGHLRLDEIPFDLKSLLAEIISVLNVVAVKKKLKLAYEVDDNVPQRLVGDPKCIRQILFNLINNAIKFTEEGRVNLTVRTVEKRDDTVELEFYVRDTGIGIAEDKLDVIFDRFIQADSSTTRAFGGTGLGTTISKKFVEMMGGKIWVESKLGKGSTFYFTVKMKVAEKGIDERRIRDDSAEEEIITFEKALKILIVEDSEDNLMLMQKYLKSTPHSVDTAGNGEIAVNKLKSGVYDLVIMDLEMPVKDGYTATREIRAWEKEKGEKPVPIVALTAHALKEHEQQSMNAGCTAHLNKPIKKQGFLQAIKKYGKP